MFDERSPVGYYERTHAPVAQWIERWPAEPKVRGSTPLGRTTLSFKRFNSIDEKFPVTLL